MSRKYLYFTALLLLILFITSNCIVVVPRGSSGTDNQDSPKAKTIKGKFLVKSSKSLVILRNNAGTLYELTGLSKADITRFLKLNGKYASVEIQVLAKSKSKRMRAKFIRFL